MDRDFVVGFAGALDQILARVLGAIRHKKSEVVNDYQEELRKADLGKIARLIKVAASRL